MKFPAELIEEILNDPDIKIVESCGCDCSYCLGEEHLKCEYRNHHCDNCHKLKICSVVECGFNFKCPCQIL